jgi:hypothetical protein
LLPSVVTPLRKHRADLIEAVKHPKRVAGMTSVASLGALARDHPAASGAKSLQPQFGGTYFSDDLSLVKDDGTWRIVHKTYYAHPA